MLSSVFPRAPCSRQVSPTQQEASRGLDLNFQVLLVFLSGRTTNPNLDAKNTKLLEI